MFFHQTVLKQDLKNINQSQNKANMKEKIVKIMMESEVLHIFKLFLAC